RRALLHPHDVLIDRTEDYRSERCSGDWGASVFPFMDFGVTVCESKAAGLIVVASGSVLKFTCHHSHCKSSVVETAVILIQEDPKPGWSRAEDLSGFAISEPRAVSSMAVSAVKPGTIHRRRCPAGVRIGADRLAHGKGSRGGNALA